MVLELNHHTITFFTENLVAIEKEQKEKRQILINKPVYLGLSIPGLRKILIYEFWYDYVKPNYGEKAKL